MPRSSKRAAGTKLADALSDRFGNSFPSWTSGTIAAITGNNCTVTILGDSYTDIHYLIGYTPAIGDVVMLASGGGQMFILGKLS